MGKIWLVGAGPGDPDLITVKGKDALQRADVILYDRLVNQELLTYAKLEAKLIYCGKLPNVHHLQQVEINQLLVDHAKLGKQVVRLKGGDPFVFGRGGEEASFAASHRIEFEVIPGITAGIAAPAYAGIPVTHRDYSASFAVITGHRKTNSEADEKQWKALAQGIDTLSIYMGIKNIHKIKETLIKYGKDPLTPTAVIHWGTTNDQRTVTGTLVDIDHVVEEHQIKNPSIVVIGEVVRLHKQLQWFVEQSKHEVLL